MRYRTIALAASLLLGTAPLAAVGVTPGPFAGTAALAGLLPVHVDKADGRILLTLPPPAADGVSGRFLYATALRTGLGSAELGFDRAWQGPTQILAFRRLGKKIAAQFENPRFRAGDAPAAEQAAARDSFAFTTAWMGDVVATLPDGSTVVDIAGFLARDQHYAAQLAESSAKGFHHVEALSAADPASLKVFPDNIEVDALVTLQSDTPGAEIANIAPDPHAISLTVHHSFVRLPDGGYRPRRYDPRGGSFTQQVVDFAVPLGGNMVYDLASRFRLDKVDPAAPRSRVKKPITFYIDRSAPEPIRSALADGVGWWAKAFEAAGYIDAFQVKILPEGVDPLDVRYNVVNWIDRATRGWSYGQWIADPRTGEIVKGSVLLGALRVRQDILVYEGLVGADKVGKGCPNDPVQVALARIRQLGAHEVGHAIGLTHNFAASTQDRASVMDYPAPHIGLDAAGAPDLSDAYGVGVGRWDRFAVDWLYGEPLPGTDPAVAARAKADAAADLRYMADADSRATATAQPLSSMWDDGPDPAAELRRLLGVRRAALDRFGPNALMPGEPVANLRRKLVPIWLLHRYEVDAAAKAIGGVSFDYAVAGQGTGASPPAPAAMQRDALAALLATLDPAALRVPDRLLPLLSSPRNGSTDRQYDIEVFATAGGPVFDPLVATDVAAQLALEALLAPSRLQRVVLQHARDPGQLGLEELLDRIEAVASPPQRDPVTRRIAYRLVATLARIAVDPATTPEVAAALDAHLRAIAKGFERVRGADAGWATWLARQIGDPAALAKLAGERPRAPAIPPGMPIGGGGPEWMDGA